MQQSNASAMEKSSIVVSEIKVTSDTKEEVSFSKQKKIPEKNYTFLQSESRNYLISFFLPVLILGLAFALNKVFPFGDRQILIEDFYHQYYPFLSNFWHTIRQGDLSPWSWTAGAGNEYLAFIAYYLASPLNLLTLLAPHAWLRETLTIIILFKIGFAGLFMAVYLRKSFGQNTITMAFFASFYALCAFALGYHYNIMWLDSFALLPLVILGFEALMRDGKYKLYIVSLAFAVFCNFYIGFYICIFIAISFLNQCILLKLNFENIFRKFFMVAVFSAIAIGLTAVLTLPAFFALQNTFTAGNRFTDEMIALHYYFHDLLGNFIAFTPPTSLDGLPNIYSGMLSILLTALFFTTKRIPLREKLIFSWTMFFLIISCNLNVLYYAWNGFRFTNQIPFRFSFIISFILVTAAYKSFLLTDNFKQREILPMGIGASIILLMAIIGSQKPGYIIASAFLCVIYLIIFYSSSGLKNSKLKIALNCAFLILILIELSGSSYIAVRTNLTTPRSIYPDRYEDIQTLLKMRKTQENNFYRTEFSRFFTINDPSLYNYNGISFFSSTVNIGTNRFTSGLGLPSIEELNRILYQETSPLTNSILGIRYQISRDGYIADDNVFWQPIGSSGNSLLLENRHHLPLGFMVNKNLSAYVPDNNAFQSNNNFFRLATGLEENLFTIHPLDDFLFILREDTDGRFPLFLEWEYEMPNDGILYAFFKRKNVREIEVSLNGQRLRTYNTSLFTAGNFSQGDIVTFLSGHGVPIDDDATMELTYVMEQTMADGYPLFYIASINEDLFDQGYSILSSSPLVLTEFSSTRIKGEVKALNYGLLYTSIPTDGNWLAYVNGVESEVVLIGGAMLAIPLSEGLHQIEFVYRNNLLTLGIFISLISLSIFIILILLKTRSQRKKSFNAT